MSQTHYWTTTRVQLVCSLGGHTVSAGTRVRFRKGVYPPRGICEHCLAQSGVTTPEREMSRVGEFADRFDLKRIQAGDK